MANTAGICNSFKLDMLDGKHDLGGTDVFKFALYDPSASISPSTTAYTATGEVSDPNYTAGGNPVSNGTPALDGSIAHWTPTASVSWADVSFTTDCALLYNDTDAGKAAIASFTFGSQTVTNGTFTLQMPVDDGTSGLIRVA